MDLLLDYGDISIEQTEIDNLKYDLLLEDSNTFISKLLRRALETPIGYIKTAIQSANSIDFIDADFGNPLYTKLAEPLTMSFLVEVQKDIETAVQSLSNIPGLVIKKIAIVNYSLNNLDIEVIYTYNQENINSQISLPL